MCAQALRANLLERDEAIQGLAVQVEQAWRRADSEAESCVTLQGQLRIVTDNVAESAAMATAVTNRLRSELDARNQEVRTKECKSSQTGFICLGWSYHTCFILVFVLFSNYFLAGAVWPMSPQSYCANVLIQFQKSKQISRWLNRCM